MTFKSHKVILSQKLQRVFKSTTNHFDFLSKMRIFAKLLQLSRSPTLKVGDFVKETRILTQQDLDEFSNLSGDHNPIHKGSLSSGKSLVHGAFLNSILSGMIGTKLPGPGTIVISQTFKFPSKCYINLPIEFSVELLEVRKVIRVKYESSQDGIIVFQGEAKLINKEIMN